MAKEVIVVVHGVGVKQAGVSADLLATSLEATPEEMFGLKREPPCTTVCGLGARYRDRLAHVLARRTSRNGSLCLGG
jgi:hypothetical protein